MRSCSPSTLLFFTFLCLPFLRASAQTSYANEFVDPDWVLGGNFPDNTLAAQQTIIQWAGQLANEGPWTVMSKNGTPPSGTKHDYMSFAPYWWPDCSEVEGGDSLSEAEIWTTCPYVRRDGQFNPDVRGVNDVGNFQTMSDTVFYSTLSWAFDKTQYALLGRNAVRYIRTWFLDEETRMNPNLDFAQMIRGPNGQPGSATGVLDLKNMAKIASAILILRKGESPEWTSELDEQMIAWSTEYITWLETAELALQEGNSANNHGSFYYNQLAALKLIVNDIPGAINVTNTYFSKQFLSQIIANGEQPLEAARTRPYHYRAYNLAAIITSAKIEKYADPSSNVWQRTSAEGATIQTALDHAMQFNATDSGEDARYDAELYPVVAAVASIYGDPDGKYLSYLNRADPKFSAEPYFWLYAGDWSQSVAAPRSPSTTQKATPTGVNAVDTDGAATQPRVGASSLLALVASGLLAFVL